VSDSTVCLCMCDTPVLPLWECLTSPPLGWHRAGLIFARFTCGQEGLSTRSSVFYGADPVVRTLRARHDRSDFHPILDVPLPSSAARKRKRKGFRARRSTLYCFLRKTDRLARRRFCDGYVKERRCESIIMRARHRFLACLVLFGDDGPRQAGFDVVTACVGPSVARASNRRLRLPIALGIQ